MNKIKSNYFVQASQIIAGGVNSLYAPGKRLAADLFL